jgi:hypothetical protein
MKLITLAAALIIFASFTVYGQMNEGNPKVEPKTEQELKALRREFFEAQKRGDRSALERLIADGFTFVHSTGVIENRKAYIDRTVAQASRSPEIEFLDEQLRVYENGVAVWVSRAAVRAKGDSSESNFRSTDVVVKIGKQWQWISVHSTRLPTRPTAAVVALETLRSYAGQYQISADRILTVTEEGGNLRGKVAGVRQSDLIPKSETEFVWFSPDSNVDMRIIFTIDESGRVADALLRSDGKEVWRAKKLK